MDPRTPPPGGTGTQNTLLAASSSCSWCLGSKVSSTVCPLQSWCVMGLFSWTLKMKPGKEQQQTSATSHPAVRRRQDSCVTTDRPVGAGRCSHAPPPSAGGWSPRESPANKDEAEEPGCLSDCGLTDCGLTDCTCGLSTKKLTHSELVLKSIQNFSSCSSLGGNSCRTGEPRVSGSGQQSVRTAHAGGLPGWSPGRQSDRGRCRLWQTEGSKGQTDGQLSITGRQIPTAGTCAGLHGNR